MLSIQLFNGIKYTLYIYIETKSKKDKPKKKAENDKEEDKERKTCGMYAFKIPYFVAIQ